MKQPEGKVAQSRVDFRVPAPVKARFLEAAEYASGGDLTAFLVAAGLERADRVLMQREILEVDGETRERFHQAMRAPGNPSVALRQLLDTGDERFRLVE